MPPYKKMTTKEYAEAAAERLKKSKSGTTPTKEDVKKSSNSRVAAPSKRNTKKS